MKKIIYLFLAASIICSDSFANEKTLKMKLGTTEEGQKALMALNSMLAAYADGDSTALRQNLDLKMIGYQKFLDSSTEESSKCKQMTFKLIDTQVQAAPDLVVIQSGWEKRCLLLPNMVPKYSKGHATFLLQSSEGGAWNMTGVSGNSPMSITTQFGN